MPFDLTVEDGVSFASSLYSCISERPIFRELAKFLRDNAPPLGVCRAITGAQNVLKMLERSGYQNLAVSVFSGTIMLDRQLVHEYIRPTRYLCIQLFSSSSS